MINRLIAVSAFLATSSADHAKPSSLLQISSANQNEGQPSIDAFLSTMNKDVESFRRKMDAEARADEEQVHKMTEQQHKIEREEKAFRAKILAHREEPPVPAASLLESSTHFGDPYIDEAMRVIGDDIDAQKRDLQRVISSHGAAPGAFVEENHEGPNLELIAEALRTRLNMVAINHIMRSLWSLFIVPSMGLFNFNDLMGRVQQATLKFDRQAEDIKNREEDEIRNIEMREKDADRSLEANMEKFHWQRSTPSFLERRLHHKKLHVKARPVTADVDMRILEETEKQRELAEKNFLKVEKEIADLPDKLLGTSDRQKSALDVPLDDQYDEDYQQ